MPWLDAGLVPTMLVRDIDLSVGTNM